MYSLFAIIWIWIFLWGVISTWSLLAFIWTHAGAFVINVTRLFAPWSTEDKKNKNDLTRATKTTITTTTIITTIMAHLEQWLLQLYILLTIFASVNERNFWLPIVYWKSDKDNVLSATIILRAPKHFYIRSSVWRSVGHANVLWSIQRKF